MNSLIVISPEGESINKDIDDTYEHVDALKEYLDEENISYDEDINNGHKLCLDLAKDGYWIFRLRDNASIMYIGKDLTPKQFNWFSYNSQLIDQMNIISIASWYDTKLVSGYDKIEESDFDFNTLEKRRDKVFDLKIEKNRNYEKDNKKTKFSFFRRAK